MEPRVPIRVTEALRDAARKHDAAHGVTLNHIADAVAIFDAGKVLDKSVHVQDLS